MYFPMGDFDVISCIRGPGVCGGRLFPALHPSSQPHQPGGDQRQTGVHENREGRSEGKFREDFVVKLHVCFAISYCITDSVLVHVMAVVQTEESFQRFFFRRQI